MNLNQKGIAPIVVAIIVIVIVIIAGIIGYFALIRETELPTQEPTPASPPIITPEVSSKIQAWQIFQDTLIAIKNRNLNKLNSISYKQYDPKKDCPGISEEVCWQMLEVFAFSLIETEKLKKDDFVNFEEDDKQIVMFTNPITSNTSQTKSVYALYVLFVKDPNANIKILQQRAMSYAEEKLKDTDRDGLTDWEECTGPSPICTRTDSNRKDTDGDGWWDGIEVAAKTDPNNPQEHPYSY